MEDVDDEDDLPRNVAPLKKSNILELSDGSDDDHEPRVPVGDMVIEEDDDNDPPPPLVDDDDDDSDEEDEEEESAEAELGQFHLNRILILH
jgi:hypothetical protein